ncbi:F-box domain-containing protein [Caenorhabditis elegans]|uniref:F-box domain-containing protein n=1 Tax=Caenorhabditis elegans TaxID=6239 RepID=Q9U2F8_CAEEL|nr:F-box domain-containing protein [Caenorhabditis elegans]CAB60353.1 F-box domain-containing protein [Caenorhabditis elegans]|eukprot:NP_496714.1 Uncharacterized protein CELE_Y46G5A.8 [Caenorhabditis elegans]
MWFTSGSPFPLLKLPLVAISEVLDHMDTGDICALRVTSQKTKNLVQQSARRFTDRPKHLCQLDIIARRDHFILGSRIGFDRCTELYKGRDIDRLLGTTSDLLDNLHVEHVNLDIRRRDEEVEIHKIVTMLLRKKANVFKTQRYEQFCEFLYALFGFYIFSSLFLSIFVRFSFLYPIFLILLIVIFSIVYLWKY